MIDRPILFSAPMVCALLDGRKTKTRRLAWTTNRGRKWQSLWARVQPGDRLWVREAWRVNDIIDGATVYRADCSAGAIGPWKPGIHMHRARSRLTLTLTENRAERLQSISESDAIAEGAVEDWADGLSVWYFPGGWALNVKQHGKTAAHAYRWLWEALNGPGSWDANPEVVALTFTVSKANIDALPKREAA